MRIAVAGAGVAGLASALALSRHGHEVCLLERDQWHSGTDWQSALDWPRSGIPHYDQPHAFLPRGALILRREFPDVYEALLAAGAAELEVWKKLPGDDLQPGDRELVYLAVRRQLIEWALRNAVAREPGVQVIAGARVNGLLVHGQPVPVVGGVTLEAGSDVVADLVVDAMGRTSKSAAWLEAAGGPAIEQRTAPMGSLYYSRYYQLRPGRSFPQGPWITSPRGDLGYAGFATFLGDNGTFAIYIGIPAFDHELRILRADTAFTAGCLALPALAPLIDEELARPITGVLPMGAMHNALRSWSSPSREPVARGLMPVGDAYCHTDPALALGLSMSLHHPVSLASALDQNPLRLDDALAEHLDAIEPEAAERFQQSCAFDEARERRFRGEVVDFSHRTGSNVLFVAVAGGAVAMRDPEVFRKVVRRTAFLDRLSVLDEDQELQERIESQFGLLMQDGLPPPAGPDRAELLAKMRSAAVTAAAG